MMEGTLPFAGALARRFGVNTAARGAFPFCVEAVAVGYGSAAASDETADGSRADLWVPLWDTPASLQEVQQLFAKGRTRLGRRQARNAVEFSPGHLSPWRQSWNSVFHPIWFFQEKPGC